MKRTGAFLVVDDDRSVLRAFGRVLLPYGEVVCATSVATALATLATTKPILGLILDIGLEDGSGLDVLAVAREQLPIVPALLVTGSNNRQFINRAYDLRASYVCKPVGADRLRQFARTALGELHDPQAPAAAKALPKSAKESPKAVRPPQFRIPEAISAYAEEFGLTPHEIALVQGATLKTPAVDVVALPDVNPNTLKSQIRRLLRKTGKPNMAAVRDAVVARVIDRARR